MLVNNLGIFGSADPLEISDDEWRRYFEVNVLSAVRLIRTSLPGMTARGWGRVLNIASDSAVVVPTEMIHYGMTKTALLSVSRGFAKDAAGSGVTVNSVMAGFSTQMKSRIHGILADLVMEAVNADGTADLPFPTVVVLDANGAIAFIDVHPNYTTRTETADILAAVDALG